MLAEWLVQSGHEAAHVIGVDLATAEDPAIWLHAVATHAALITKDADLLAIRINAAAGPAVIWLRIGNATNRNLIGWFARRFPAVIDALLAGESIVEVR